MKCNIKYGVKIQEKNVIRCCICGEEIAVQESNNPYPVRDWSAIGSTTNRCCHKCNREFVMPSRIIRMTAESKSELNTLHNTLKKMSYPELKSVFDRCRAYKGA